MSVFVVHHQDVTTGDDHPRFIGVYSRRESAAAAVTRLSQAMGCGLDGFSVERYALDHYADAQAPEPLDDDGLWDVRGRAIAASPGPWRACIEERDAVVHGHVRTGFADQRGPDIEISGASAADCDFIAHARDDVPRLLETIMELKAQLSGKCAA